jgi:hypothetical protein
MSRTFSASKEDATRREVAMLHLLWRLHFIGVLPISVPRWWMRRQGWRPRNLIEFRARLTSKEER